MRKPTAAKRSDDLRRAYDLPRFQGGVRGKYYPNAAAESNLVLIDPDLAERSPDSEAVNRALRLLTEAAQAATTPKHRRTR